MLFIEHKDYIRFMSKFKRGGFGSQRLGQAFYNQFNLHDLADQSALKNLYAKDGEHAVNLIKEVFTFN